MKFLFNIVQKNCYGIKVKEKNKNLAYSKNSVSN